MKSLQNSPLHLSTGFNSSYLEYDEIEHQQLMFFRIRPFSIERTSTPSKTPVINPLLYIIGTSFFQEQVVCSKSSLIDNLYLFPCSFDPQ